jgi:hypothetical protein
MAALAQKCEHDVLSPADLLRKIEKLRENLSKGHVWLLRMMADFVHPMSMYRGQ